jgi:hypothetical protein
VIATRRNLFPRSKVKINPIRQIPSVIQKESSLTWKDLSKSGRTKCIIWNHGRAMEFFIVKIGFYPIKCHNSFRKSLKLFFLEITKSIQYLMLTSFIESWILLIFFCNLSRLVNAFESLLNNWLCNSIVKKHVSRIR